MSSLQAAQGGKGTPGGKILLRGMNLRGLSCRILLGPPEGLRSSASMIGGLVGVLVHFLEDSLFLLETLFLLAFGVPVPVAVVAPPPSPSSSVACAAAGLGVLFL